MAENNNNQKKVEKKPGFLKGVRLEANKVTWYSKAATLKNTAWILATLVILGAVVGLVDLGLIKLLGLIG